MRLSFTLEEAAEAQALLDEYPVEGMEGKDLSAEVLLARLRGGKATERVRRVARKRVKLAGLGADVGIHPACRAVRQGHQCTGLRDHSGKHWAPGVGAFQEPDSWTGLVEIRTVKFS